MGRKAIDLTGQRFGKWTVLEKSQTKTKQGKTQWICQCDCGEIKEIANSNLNRGKSNSCGCSRRKDLTGKKYGTLTPIIKSDKLSSSGKTQWECMCDCGNIVKVDTSSLLSGNTCSCGCSRIHDLTNRKFGRWTTIKLSDKEDKYGRAMWECVCECGTKRVVESNSLKRGTSKSCGCLHSEIKRASCGKNHPNYDTNLTDEERLAMRYDLYGNNMPTWRKEIFSNDDFTCQACNKRGYKLNAHHLNAWNAFPEQRFDTANGITLCSDCHKEYHHFNGYGDNTLEQFRDHVACTVGEEHVSEIEEVLLSRESEIIGQEVKQQQTRELQTT